MTGDPIFIVGCPRSGTTLLSVLLDRHSEVAVTSETAFYDDVAPELAQMAPSDLVAILTRWPRLSELGLTAFELLNACNPQPSSMQLLGAILELYAQKRSKPRCGEKTPQHLRHIPTILADFPSARVLCMIRDGRDVALSLRAMPWGPSSLTDCAAMWLDANRLIDNFSARFASQMLVVRYESLVSQPEVVLAAVMDHLNLDFQPQQLSPGSSDVVLKRSLAWKGAALDAVNPSFVGHRRNDRHDVRYLEGVLGDDLKRLNYLIS